MPRSRTFVASLAVGLLCLSSAGAAKAEAPDRPDPADEVRLAGGQTVSYPQTLYSHGRRYVGGVTYTVINASVAELTGLLADPAAYTAVLPHARDARIVGDADGDRLVEITQGISFVQAAYTLRIRTAGDPHRVRFWLDHSRPHAISDAWGYFRAEPLADAADGSPRVLLTYGVLVDLGPGVVRDLFESRIQASMLTIPDRLRQYASARFHRRALHARVPRHFTRDGVVM